LKDVGYRAEATKLEAGSIVKVEKPLSSTGHTTHPHYFVVLNVPDGVRPGDLIPLLGITSTITNADPRRHVPMKWLGRRGGDPDTGFDRPCYACVDFMHVLEVRRGEVFPLEVAAEYEGRFVSAEKLQTIVALKNAWARR
jgi:hypothetical protein